MTKYTKDDIGTVLVPVNKRESDATYFWRVVEFAKTLGYNDDGVDYTEDNYGLGERGTPADYKWAEARVAYGKAIDYIGDFLEGVSLHEEDAGLTIGKHWFEIWAEEK